MRRSAARRRVAVLAYTLRAREQARRVFRSLGYAPLVLDGLDELLALGPRAGALDLLLLGDAPAMDRGGRPVLACVRGAIGEAVPLLQFRFARGAANVFPPDRTVALPRFFGELCEVVLSFLEANGLEVTPPRLAWDAYAFQPREGTVSFGDREVALDPIAFDVMLELFYRAGQVVNKKTLMLMLPSDAPASEQRRIDNLGTLIKELRSCLRLRGLHGWELETYSHVGYRLART
ncbi:MAG: helix-turn-helix domain-containing protein [Variovorax sp.]|nr:helix-turn-helix domain-containing protein [Variovorax sp.]